MIFFFFALNSQSVPRTEGYHQHEPSTVGKLTGEVVGVTYVSGADLTIRDTPGTAGLNVTSMTIYWNMGYNYFPTSPYYPSPDLISMHGAS